MLRKSRVFSRNIKFLQHFLPTTFSAFKIGVFIKCKNIQAVCGFWLVMPIIFIMVILQNAHAYDEERLFTDLFLSRENYSALARPVFNKSQPVAVDIDLAYVQLVKLDDSDQSLKSNVWIRQFWRNDFVTWNPRNYGGVEEIVVDKKWLWKPDLVLFNSADGSLNAQVDQHKTRIKVAYHGLCTWYIPAIMISGCSIDIRYYPFDYQRCELTFLSWSYQSNELTLNKTRERVDMSSYQESADFAITDTRVRRRSQKYSCCVHPFVDVTFTLVLRRQPGSYVINLIFPSAVLTYFAIFVFVSPEATGERVGLAIQCFLTICIMMNMVSNMIPIDSNVTPLLGVYLLACMIAITMCIVFNAFVFNCAGSWRVPAWLHDLVFNRFAAMFVWRECFRRLNADGCPDPTILCEGMFAAIQRKKLIDDRQEEEDLLERYMKFRVSACDCDTDAENFKTLQRFFKDVDSLPNAETLQNAYDMENIGMLVDNLVSEVEGEQNGEFWKCMAHTVDRFLLLFFTIVYFMLLFAIFLEIPSGNFIL